MNPIEFRGDSLDCCANSLEMPGGKLAFSLIEFNAARNRSTGNPWPQLVQATAKRDLDLAQRRYRELSQEQK